MRVPKWAKRLWEGWHHLDAARALFQFVREWWWVVFAAIKWGGGVGTIGVSVLLLVVGWVSGLGFWLLIGGAIFYTTVISAFAIMQSRRAPSSPIRQTSAPPRHPAHVGGSVEPVSVPEDHVFYKVADGTEGRAVTFNISPPSPSANFSALVMQVSDKKTVPADYGAPLDVLVSWQSAHRFTIPGKGLIFVTGKMEITNRSGRALSLQPRVVIKRDPHSIPDQRIRQLIEEKKPDAVEASLELSGLSAMPSEALSWAPQNVPYFPSPITIKIDETTTGFTAFLLEEQFIQFAGSEYRGFDFLLIDLVSDCKAIMPWGHGYPQ